MKDPFELEQVVKELQDAQTVCYEAYQLIWQLDIPNKDKWLDNLSEAKMVHTDLLPVIIPKHKTANDIIQIINIELEAYKFTADCFKDELGVDAWNRDIQVLEKLLETIKKKMVCK